jgi:hypothetical protein
MDNQTRALHRTTIEVGPAGARTRHSFFDPGDVVFRQAIHGLFVNHWSSIIFGPSQLRSQLSGKPGPADFAEAMHPWPEDA